MWSLHRRGTEPQEFAQAEALREALRGLVEPLPLLIGDPNPEGPWVLLQVGTAGASRVLFAETVDGPISLAVPERPLASEESTPLFPCRTTRATNTSRCAVVHELRRSEGDRVLYRDRELHRPNRAPLAPDRSAGSATLVDLTPEADAAPVGELAAGQAPGVAVAEVAALEEVEGDLAAEGLLVGGVGRSRTRRCAGSRPRAPRGGGRRSAGPGRCC